MLSAPRGLSAGASDPPAVIGGSERDGAVLFSLCAAGGENQHEGLLRLKSVLQAERGSQRSPSSAPAGERSGSQVSALCSGFA